MAAASKPLPLDVPPMEAEVLDELPPADGWQFEPKYDGVRCLGHRRGRRVHLLSRSQKPPERCFPQGTRALDAIEGDRRRPGKSMAVTKTRLR